MYLHKKTKKELVWMATHTCKHGHNFLAHPECYKGDTKEKLGVLDIETTNLNASFGFIISYVIKEVDGPSYERLITQAEIRSGKFDKQLVKSLIKDIRRFDRLLTYYGARFDIPFIRTRAELHKLDFPSYAEIKSTDVYDLVKRKMRLHRNRLQTICEFLDIPAKSHPMTPTMWSRAMAGDKDALNYILEHNKEDVLSTEEVYRRLIKYGILRDTSL